MSPAISPFLAQAQEMMMCYVNYAICLASYFPDKLDDYLCGLEPQICLLTSDVIIYGGHALTTSARGGEGRPIFFDLRKGGCVDLVLTKNIKNLADVINASPQCRIQVTPPI